jgi:hypothetical protein
MSAAQHAQNSNKLDYQQVLLNWDAKAEQDKADFLNILYDFYRPSNCCYTGLYQQFAADLLASFKALILSGEFELLPVVAVDDTDSLDDCHEPLCDI